MTDKEKLDAIRAEICRLVNVRGYNRGMANDLFAFMDSLPNEPISKDLEKEIKDYFDSQPIITRSKGLDYRLIPTGVDIAKHFYELGLKAQKGE